MKKGMPTFIGIYHWPGLDKGVWEKVQPLLKPGTKCFMEGSPAGFEKQRKSQETYEEPFAKILKELDRRGIEVVPLDRDKLPKMIGEIERKVRDVDSLRQDPKKGLEMLKVLRYIMHPLREKGWKGKLQRNATADDLVIMHPGHLSRLKYTMKIPARNMVWIHKPSPFGMTRTEREYIDLWFMEQLTTPSKKLTDRLVKSREAYKRKKAERRQKAAGKKRRI